MDASNKLAFRHQAIIILAACAIFFVNLGATGLWDLDEALFTSIAREMSARGDWIVPTFNGSLFYDKPPLMFWLMMGSFKILGESEFAARLPAALLALGTVLATYHLARRLFSEKVGFWAGLIVSSNIIFTVSARAATVDSALAFLTTLAMAWFAKGAGLGEAARQPRKTIRGGRRQLTFLPASWAIYAAIGIVLGLAVLAKGPVGFLLPAASMGLFLLVMNSPSPEGDITKPGWADQTGALVRRTAAMFSPRNLFRVTWAMRPLTVLGFAALTALPWFALVAWKTDGEWISRFITKYNIGPFVHPFLGHRGPFYYHFVVVLIGLFPWSIFLGPTVAHVYRMIRNRAPNMPSYIYLACWIGVFFGFWSACSTKLPHYVLPAYPALAILTACFLRAWVERTEAPARYAMPMATGILLAVGVVLLAVLPWLAARFVPGDAIIALVGLAPLLGGGAAMFFLLRGRRQAYLNWIAAASASFIIALFGWAELRIDRHQHSRPLLEAVRHDSPATPQIAGYNYCDASTVYYAREPVAEIKDPARLQAFIERSPHPYVITTGADFADLKKRLPGQWRVVARRPRFLKKGEIVVLAPPCPLSALSRRNGESEEAVRR